MRTISSGCWPKALKHCDVAFLLVCGSLSGHNGVVIPELAVCQAAIAAKDRRFDGQFITGVTSTGIYCRPSCPARTPKPENVTFFPGPAAAQQAGFRACRRCDPDASPGAPDWDRRSDLVARAVRLLRDGWLDRDSLAGLAAHLGYSSRQLQRSITDELGASPIAVARAARVQTAHTLLRHSQLSISDIAFAAGFGSIRSFNDTVLSATGCTPKQLRGRPNSQADGVLQLKLAYREPLEPSNLFGHLAATAVPGVEEWRDGWYRRTMSLPKGWGILELKPADRHIAARLRLSELGDLTAAISRIRFMLDLDADPVVIDQVLLADPVLAESVASHSGRRVPRTVSGAEFALRAVIGQQVSTAAARTQTGRIVERFGTEISDPDGGLNRLFPSPSQLLDLRREDLPGFKTRAETLVRLAARLRTGLDLDPGADWQEARTELAAIPGVGDWTIEMIAMRSLGEPDAFPAGDLGLKRAAAHLGIENLALAAENWRPWRSYATQYLWATDDHPINQLPKD